MSNRSGVAQAGEYQFKECRIKSSSGAKFNIAERLIVSMSFYESIFSNTFNGLIEIVDTANLPTNLPITGQDFFEIKLITPGIEGESIIDHVFVINQILSRRDVSTGAQSYVFSLVSPESFRNNRTRVSASFTDVNSNIVKNVMRDLKLIASNKDIFIEKTNGLRKHIVPNLRPFDFIRRLTRESTSAKSNNSPHYLFYENARGFNFITLDTLYNKLPVESFETQDKVMMESNLKIEVGQDLKNILSFTIGKSQDTLLASRGGLLSSKLTMYNIFNKEYKVYTHNYFRDFDKFTRIDENPIYNDTEIDEQGNNIADFPDANINLHPTSNSEGVNVSFDGNTTDNQAENWLLSTRSKLLELDVGQAVELEVHGRTGLCVGDKINLNLPVSGKTLKGEELDKVYSGDYLITDLSHKFDLNPHVHGILMTVVKDAITKPHQKGIGDTKEPKKDGIDIEV